MNKPDIQEEWRVVAKAEVSGQGRYEIHQVRRWTDGVLEKREFFRLAWVGLDEGGDDLAAAKVNDEPDYVRALKAMVRMVEQAQS